MSELRLHNPKNLDYGTEQEAIQIFASVIPDIYAGKSVEEIRAMLDSETEQQLVRRGLKPNCHSGFSVSFVLGRTHNEMKEYIKRFNENTKEKAT